MRLSFIALLAVISLTVHAQNSLFFQSADLSARTSVATNATLRPLFSYSNKWGHEVMYNRSGAILEGNYKADLFVGRFHLNAGFSGQIATEKDRLKIYQAYLHAKFMMLDLQVGMQEYTPVLSNSDLSTGSYLMSNNTRPVPQVMAGLFDWWSVPYTHNWLQLRGGVAFGRLDNEGNKAYTDGILFHQKFAYAAIGGFQCVKPYMGLVHSVLMGGKMANGKKIPVDLWNSMWAMAGADRKFEDVLPGEATNAAGGHNGMWDFGVILNINAVNALLYYQRPFADATGRSIFPSDKTVLYEEGAKDFTLGVNISLPIRALRNIVVEYVNTEWQGGESLPDPKFVDDNSKLIFVFPYNINDDNYNKWMTDHIDPQKRAAYEAKYGPIKKRDDVFLYIRRTYNDGEHYGGRSNYLSNALYPQGWTRHELSMGSALFQTKNTVLRYADADKLMYYSNLQLIRLRAFNIGVKGEIAGGLSYRFRYTFSKNYGNRVCAYNGGAFGMSDFENYYFKQPKNENYTELGLNYTINSSFSANCNISADWGDMYNSAAIQLGVRYRIPI